MTSPPRTPPLVAVLMGGWSAEREVSLVSGRACAAALREAGFRVSEIDVDRDICTRLREVAPDICFNALHGPIGEDGSIQGLLNILGIPYTHSGVLASAVAMDKPQAKRLFAAAGLRCPEGRVMDRAAFAAGHPMPPAYVVKPTNEGSSVGVRIVREGDNAPPVGEDWAFGDEVLVERYIPGRELTVGVMGDKALAVTEIQPKETFFDYTAKYTAGRAVHVVPAAIPADVYDAALEMALSAHRVLGCRGVSRADIRWDDRLGVAGLYLLEVNTQPGMTPLSLVPEQAAHLGVSFRDLVAGMVDEARCDA
ncbi:MAG: D-alanine--D-alanine ligase [Thalassobaculales bacterium]